MKVQNEMSTRISVNAVAAIGSMKAFRNAISAASNSWRAQETALKSAGNYSEAVRQRISGLNQVIDLQKAKVKELREEQSGLNLSNKKQANQFLKLEKQISQSNRQLASYQAQLQRARESSAYQVSGLAKLQSSYRSTERVANAYIARLNAEGKTASATVERYKTLKSGLSNLEEQYRKQEFMLKQVENQYGRNSSQYAKQREQLDKTATSIAKTKDEVKSLATENAKLQPTGFNRFDSAIVKVNNHTAQMRTKMVSAFDTIKSHAMSVGTAIVGITSAVASSAKKAGEVQKTMVENQNLMTTAGEKSKDAQKEVNQMYSQGEQLSIKFGVSQKEIADGYQTLIKRGYDGKQSLGAMNSILKASKASGDSFDDTMRVTTATLESFGMKVESTKGMMQNTAKVADILAKAADVTSTSFKDIGEAMTYAGPSAKATGVTLKETSAILGVLSNNGLEATQAGTGLQRILTRLAAPTDTAKAALRQYNMSIDDFKTKSGKLKPVSEIFKEINKHVPKADRLEFFNKVFGQTAQNAASILSSSTKDLDKVNKQLNNAYKQDYAGKLAEKNMRAAKNSQDRFKYASQYIQIEIGRSLLPAISKASVQLANAFSKKSTRDGLKQLATGIGEVANATVSFLSFLSKHTTTVKVFGSALVIAFGAAKLLDAIGRTRRRINDLRAVIKKFPRRKLTHIEVDSKQAIRSVNETKTTLNKIPRNKRTSVEVDTRSAQKNLRAMGTTSTAVARTTKLSFASIKLAGVSSIKAIGLAIRMNPIGAIFTSVQIAISAFQMLYEHSEKFRRFVNGIKDAAGKAMKGVGNWFKNTFTQIGKSQRQANRQQIKANKESEKQWRIFTNKLSKGWKSYWNNRQRQQQQAKKREQKYWNQVGKSAKSGWKAIETNTRNGVSQVGRWYNNMNKNTSKVIRNMYRRHPKTFQSMYKVIQDRTRRWHDLVTGHWSRLKSDTARLAKDQSRANNNIFEDMYSAINKKTGGWLGKVVDSWKDHMSQIGDAISAGKKKAGAAMADLANGVLKPFKTLIDDIQGGINWVLNKVGGNKLDGSWSAAIPTFATGTKGNPNGLKKTTIGMVNDGAGSHWRELYSYKGHVGAFPNKRNFITYLPEGMSILNGEDSHQLMKMVGIPHFANGVGDFFKAIKDGSDDLMEYVDDILKAPVEFMKDVFKKFVKVTTNIPFAQKLVTSVPEYIAKQLGNWVKKQFATLDNPGGAGVERWRPYIIRAFKELGVAPAEWKVAKLLRQIQTESGGDPHAFQHGYVDANTGGNEARGLLQFAGSTWRADALPGHTDWRNGYNEILAAIAVLERGGEGGWGNVGNGHGWANGGLISTHGMYEVGEGNNPEMIIPLTASKRGRAYQLLSEVMAQFKHEDGPAQPTRDDQSINKDNFKSLESKLDQLHKDIQALISLGTQQVAAIHSQGKFDPKRQDILQAQRLSMKLNSF